MKQMKLSTVVSKVAKKILNVFSKSVQELIDQDEQQQQQQQKNQQEQQEQQENQQEQQEKQQEQQEKQHEQQEQQQYDEDVFTIVNRNDEEVEVKNQQAAKNMEVFRSPPKRKAFTGAMENLGISDSSKSMRTEDNEQMLRVPPNSLFNASSFFSSPPPSPSPSPSPSSSSSSTTSSSSSAPRATPIKQKGRPKKAASSSSAPEATPMKKKGRPKKAVSLPKLLQESANLQQQITAFQLSSREC